MRLRARLLTPFLAVVLTSTALAHSGCVHRPTTIVTQQGKIAYTADQIAVRVSELQNAAIAANAQQQLSDEKTRTIVQFCVASARVLAQTPNGWQASLQTAWTQAKSQAGAITNPAVVAAMGAVDVVLAMEGQ